jgi:hypothetical protein
MLISTVRSKTGPGSWLKELIESVYTDGISAILRATINKGTISGKFLAGNKVFDFNVSPKNTLSYSEIEASGGRSDSYLIGFTLRLDKNCDIGTPCKTTCITRGKVCEKPLGPKAVQLANQVRALGGSSSSEKPLKFSPKAIAGLSSLATTAILGAAIATIVRDVQKSSVDFDSIRQPPDGVPDAETLKAYDAMTPGDLVRRNFKAPLGAKQHYGVYVGKDPQTGQHMIIESSRNPKLIDTVPTILYRPMADINTNSSQYEKVPESEVFKNGDRPFTPDEVVRRAHRMRGQILTYQGYTSNCESFARAIVAGQSRSVQGDSVTRFTKVASAIVLDNGLKLRTKKGFGLSEYGKSKLRMTSTQMLEFLERERAALSRVDSASSQPAKVADVLPDPTAYAKSAVELGKAYPGISEAIQVQMFKNYLLAIFLLSEQQGRQDSTEGDGSPCGEGYISPKKVCRIGKSKGHSIRRRVTPSGDIEFRIKKSSAPKFAAAGLTSVAVASVLGVAAFQLRKDFESAGKAMAFDSIRQPPGGIPDAETLKVYDTFKPGDVIRKNFKVPGGAWQHYSVFTGKDSKTDLHMMIDVSGETKDGKIEMKVRSRSLISDASPDSTQFERVPPKELYKNKKPVFTEAEILERANLMVGQSFSYEGFESNCESFARGIVTGKAEATQRERISEFGNFVSKITTKTALSVQAGPDGIKLSDYATDKTRMTAAEMMEWLEKRQKVRKDSEEDALAPLPLPKVYALAVEVMANEYPAIADQIRVDMYKRYLMALFMASESPKSVEAA